MIDQSASIPSSSQVRETVRGAGTRVHIPALDGVRGIAVMAVLAFHYLAIDGNTPLVRLIQKTWGLGWAGVDLFFVLSGFLITGILLDAKSTHGSAGAYYKNFYARRTVRIFPLYYLFLFLFLILLPAIVPHFAELFGLPPVGQWAYWTYTYNLFQGHHQSASVFSHVLGVTWSLCIEEQFYLVWPAIVWFCAPRSLMKICFGLIATSIVSRAAVAWMSGYEVFISQWTICRMDPLAVGAMLAIAMNQNPDSIPRLRKPAWLAVCIVPVVVIAINVAFGSLAKNKPFALFGYTLLALGFGALVLLTLIAPAGSIVQRAFSNPILRAFGRVSYAMYLFNQPIKIVIEKYVFDPNNAFKPAGSLVPAQLVFIALGTAATFIVSLLSWHLFEKHFLKLKAWFPMVTPAQASHAGETPAPSNKPRDEMPRAVASA